MLPFIYSPSSPVSINADYDRWGTKEELNQGLQYSDCYKLTGQYSYNRPARMTLMRILILSTRELKFKMT